MLLRRAGAALVVAMNRVDGPPSIRMYLSASACNCAVAKDAAAKAKTKPESDRPSDFLGAGQIAIAHLHGLVYVTFIRRCHEYGTWTTFSLPSAWASRFEHVV